MIAKYYKICCQASVEQREATENLPNDGKYAIESSFLDSKHTKRFGFLEGKSCPI